MELTSLIQARSAFAGLFAGIYVAIAHIPLELGYATVMPTEDALIYGILAGIAGALFSASIFALWHNDRFWEHVCTAIPVAMIVGIAIMFFELLIPIFIFQGLLYAILGALLGAILGFWLYLLLCQHRPDGPCQGCQREDQ